MSLQGSLSIERMCELARVSRASFYRSLKERRPAEEETEVRSAIQQIALEHRRRYGYRRICAELRRRGMPANHKRVLRMMRKDNLLALRQALSHGEMAEKLSGALSRRIEFVDVAPEAMREALIGAGLPVWQADGLIEDYAHYSRGEASEVAHGVQDATGKPPRSFEDFVSNYAPAFSEATAQTTSAA
jgi:hypothetical protein